MCGIAGGCGAAGHAISARDIDRMTEKLWHRGPDGKGYYSDERVTLGHRRLSIIDIAHGDQPIYNEDRSVVIVFNGADLSAAARNLAVLLAYAVRLANAAQ